MSSLKWQSLYLDSHIKKYSNVNRLNDISPLCLLLEDYYGKHSLQIKQHFIIALLSFFTLHCSRAVKASCHQNIPLKLYLISPQTHYYLDYLKSLATLSFFFLAVLSFLLLSIPCQNLINDDSVFAISCQRGKGQQVVLLYILLNLKMKELYYFKN